MSEEGELKDFQPARGIFGYFNQTEASQFHSNPRLMTTESQKSNKLTNIGEGQGVGRDSFHCQSGQSTHSGCGRILRLVVINVKSQIIPGLVDSRNVVLARCQGWRW